MIYVVAVITAKPGMREAILQHFRANLPAVRAEKGCIEYTPVIDSGNAPRFQTPAGPDAVLVIEKWESMDALAAHAVAPHMKAFAAKIRDLMASRAVHILSPA